MFDEPSSGLDPLARRAMWDDLRKLRGERGVTVLLTTHFIEEAERCDRVGILDRGRLVAQGAPDALKRSMNKDVLVIEAEHTEVLRAEIEAQCERLQRHLWTAPLRIECERRAGDDGFAVRRFPGTDLCNQTGTAHVGGCVHTGDGASVRDGGGRACRMTCNAWRRVHPPGGHAVEAGTREIRPETGTGCLARSCNRSCSGCCWASE